MDPDRRSRLVAGLICVVVLAGLAVAGLLSITPPAPAPVDAPADEFSAERAFSHVQQIGSRVHVAGSPAAADTRNYIVSELEDLGLHPEVTDAIGQSDALGGGLAMARVRNVIVTIPGAESTGRLILVAHYDSVQVSYGANDDGSGVATLLETARALASGPALRNDLVLLFTDAEEACLCGAEAFVTQNPLAADGGVVLNFESRGSSGPAIMFETATGNADLVATYAAAVPYPVATSMAVAVYRILPNDTDFTPFRESGRFTGLNSAYIDGSAVYHSPRDRPGYVDRASLQHQGANALALARGLGNAELGPLAVPAAGDATYFPVLGLLVRYPGWLVWPLAVLGLLAVGWLALVLRRRRVTTGRAMSAGFVLALIPLVLAPAAAQGLWAVLTMIRPGYSAMIDPWRPGWYRAGVAALVALIVIGWYALLRRRFGPAALIVGALGWLALIGLALAAVTPGGSYLASLPALAGAAAGAVAVALRTRWLRMLALTLGGAVAVLVLAPTVQLFFPALGLATGAAAAVVAVLLGLALLPTIESIHPALPVGRDRAQEPADDAPAAGAPAAGAPAVQDSAVRDAEGVRRRWAGAAPSVAVAVAAVAFLVVGLTVDRFDARHPAPTQLMYALDTDTSTARWVTDESRPSDWTSQYIDGTEDLSARFPLLRGPIATGPAEATALPPPTLSVERDDSAGGQRTLTVTVHPHRSVRLIDLSAAEAVVERATVEGRSMPTTDRGFHLLFHAPPDDGVRVTLVLEGTDPVDFRVMDGSDGLTDLPGFVPRPPGVGVQGSHTSELVLVAATVTI